MNLAYKKILGKFTKVLGFGKTPPPPCWENFPNNVVFFFEGVPYQNALPMSLLNPSIYDLYFAVVIVLHFRQWSLPRKLLYGVKQFNLEPSRGLKYLEEAGFVTSDPDSVAKFLFRQERLSKRQIGEEENNKFISFEPAYIHTLVVRNIWSLWHFLSNLRLPHQFISIFNHTNR